jgi:hypothetical protein
MLLARKQQKRRRGQPHTGERTGMVEEWQMGKRRREESAKMQHKHIGRHICRKLTSKGALKHSTCQITETKIEPN